MTRKYHRQSLGQAALLTGLLGIGGWLTSSALAPGDADAAPRVPHYSHEAHPQHRGNGQRARIHRHQPPRDGTAPASLERLARAVRQDLAAMRAEGGHVDNGSRASAIETGQHVPPALRRATLGDGQAYPASGRWPAIGRQRPISGQLADGPTAAPESGRGDGFRAGKPHRAVRVRIANNGRGSEDGDGGGADRGPKGHPAVQVPITASGPHGDGVAKPDAPIARAPSDVAPADSTASPGDAAHGTDAVDGESGPQPGLPISDPISPRPAHPGNTESGPSGRAHHGASRGEGSAGADGAPPNAQPATEKPGSPATVGKAASTGTGGQPEPGAIARIVTLRDAAGRSLGYVVHYQDGTTRHFGPDERIPNSPAPSEPDPITKQAGELERATEGGFDKTAARGASGLKGGASGLEKLWTETKVPIEPSTSAPDALPAAPDAAHCVIFALLCHAIKNKIWNNNGPSSPGQEPADEQQPSARPEEGWDTPRADGYPTDEADSPSAAPDSAGSADGASSDASAPRWALPSEPGTPVSSAPDEEPATKPVTPAEPATPTIPSEGTAAEPVAPSAGAPAEPPTATEPVPGGDPPAGAATLAPDAPVPTPPAEDTAPAAPEETVKVAGEAPRGSVVLGPLLQLGGGVAGAIFEGIHNEDLLRPPDESPEHFRQRMESEMSGAPSIDVESIVHPSPPAPPLTPMPGS